MGSSDVQSQQLTSPDFEAAVRRELARYDGSNEWQRRRLLQHDRESVVDTQELRMLADVPMVLEADPSGVRLLDVLLQTFTIFITLVFAATLIRVHVTSPIPASKLRIGFWAAFLVGLIAGFSMLHNSNSFTIGAVLPGFGGIVGQVTNYTKTQLSPVSELSSLNQRSSNAVTTADDCPKQCMTGCGTLEILLGERDERDCLDECAALGSEEQREALCDPCTLTLAKGDSTDALLRFYDKFFPCLDQD